ncbi:MULTISPECIES: NUDIX hydrolase [unclassified Burkholderia]|uniref:NUDIX hydrolase n=1 Tax=unclassified Burkholderia TaxID=2613784 RepID=UPI00075681D2|nr:MULTISPECIES: NUDIX hydrolase [unclassified Burkholderia]KUY90342.1 NUDIX hydrolase [Burkholderia sp. RF7-non_BP4]KUZ03576.1 NUDIX hydrolase [Burkholderia sp. RF7-non_BP1]
MTLPDPTAFPVRAVPLAPLAKERATIVCHRNDRVLLVARRPSSRWTLPGGVIRRGESALDAARRELQEETGLADLELAYCFFVDGSVKRHHVFVARMPPGRHACPGREIALCRWVGFDAVARWPASTPTQRIVHQLSALCGQRDLPALAAITRPSAAR